MTASGAPRTVSVLATGSEHRHSPESGLIEVKGVPRMKISRVIAIGALLLTSFATARAAESARGAYQFTLGDQLTKYVQFDAQATTAGGATGSMYFSDE